MRISKLLWTYRPDLGFRSNYSYLNALTGCSVAARRAGKTLAITAINTAPEEIHATVSGSTIVGIL